MIMFIDYRLISLEMYIKSLVDDLINQGNQLETWIRKMIK